MEKQPLLGKHSSPSKKSSCFMSAISKPFQCLPRFSNPTASPSETDAELDAMIATECPLDFEVLPDLHVEIVRSEMTTTDKLLSLRKLMKQYGIAVYLVPSEDEHQSEYTALADRRREFLSGFTGSAGICVVTLDDEETLEGEAALSTDGRYFLQAEKQLDFDHWRLLKQGMAGYPSWQEFAFDKASKSKVSNVISCDPKLISLDMGDYFSNMLRHRGVSFKPLIEVNLVDKIWSDKPSRPLDPVYQLPIKYSGELTETKLAKIREILAERGASHLLITALDDIGWLFNLRSDNDIPFSPFFFSYALVSKDTVSIYADEVKIVKVKAYLLSIEGLEIKPYESFYSDLSVFKATVANPSILLILPDKTACNYALVSSIPQSISKETIIFDSIISVVKLYKNPTELFNAKVAQTKDSLAFIIFSAWLEAQLVHHKKELNEYQAAQKIYSIRSKLPNFKGLSYETISSTGPNAAIIHYAPSEEDNAIIDPSTPYLIDSGAHYLEGTTDITRTYKFGEEGLTDEYKKYYTLVLKGHLAVAMAKFPSGSTSTGTILDSYARQPLWNEGLDFNHGTGHGVGSFGNVHEGPLFILTTTGGASGRDLFKKGGIITDEPGYYVDGECGFRVESELAIIECDSSVGKTRSGGTYLGFEYLTKVPFCLKLIDPQFLTPVEKTWINEFHKNIRAEFGPKLLHMGDKRAYAWLVKETRPFY